MNKGDFVGGIQVEPIIGGTQVMTLGGSADNWICSWVENGQAMTKRFQPEQLQLASSKNPGK